MTLSQHRDGPPTIGLLIDWLDNDYASSVCFTLAEEVQSRGMRFVAFVGQNLEALAGKPRGGSFAYALASKEVLDALVVVTLGTQLPAHEQARYLERYRPLPMCTYALNAEGVPGVSVDNTAGMRHAVSHLIQFHERRKIAFVRGPTGNRDAELRYKGYREALAEFGLHYDERLDLSGDFRRESGAAAVVRLLDQRHISIDALVAANDAMAAGAQHELLSRGIRVPEDVALCGFDDVEEARFASVPISSVRQPWREQARIAVDCLLSQLEGRGFVQPEQVPAEFVPRRSCGCGVSLEWGSAAFGRPHQREGSLVDAARLLSDDPQPLRLAQSMLRVLSAHGLELDAPLALKLIESFKAGLAGEGDEFLTALEQELGRGLRSSVSLSGWYHGLAFVRREVLGLFRGDREVRLRGEQLMHVAFERVSYAAERQQAMRRLEFERQGRVLTLTGEAMITEFDMRGIEQALRERLPELGLSSFCLAQFEAGTGDMPQFSRLLLAHDTARDLGALSDAVFKTTRITPQGFWPTDRPGAYVLEPLFFQDDQLGFALFEIGPRQGAIYLTLREQLSAALKGKSLLRQVADQTLQREQAERARQDNELQISRRIRSAILPRDMATQDLDVAVGSLPGPAGAGYYDVRRHGQGVWFAIGQVLGEGIAASLCVPMLGSIVASLCCHRPLAEPAELLAIALSVMEENLRSRLHEQQHVSLLLAHYASTGQLTFAGDFSGVWLWRSDARASEREPVPASGVPQSVHGRPWEGTLRLAPRDVVVLHTAALEAPGSNESGADDAWLRSVLQRRRTQVARSICDDLIAAAEARPSQARRELSLIVARRSEAP